MRRKPRTTVVRNLRPTLSRVGLLLLVLSMGLSSLLTPACTPTPPPNFPITDGGLGGTPYKKTPPNKALKLGHWRLFSKRQPDSTWDLQLAQDPFTSRYYVRCFRFVFWLQSGDGRRTERLDLTNTNLSLLAVPVLGNKVEWTYQRCNECKSCQSCLDAKKTNCASSPSCAACTLLPKCLSCLQCKNNIEDDYCEKTVNCQQCKAGNPSYQKELCQEGPSFVMKLSLDFSSPTDFTGKVAIQDPRLKASLELTELTGRSFPQSPADEAGATFCKVCLKKGDACPVVGAENVSDAGTP